MMSSMMTPPDEDDLRPSATPDNVGTSEPDGTPDEDEAPQEPTHPNLTRPEPKMKKTNESLQILGAGKPYKSPYHS